MVGTSRVLLRKFKFYISIKNNLIYICKDVFHGIIFTSVVVYSINVESQQKVLYINCNKPMIFNILT